MSTHNICFHGEVRKIFIWVPLVYIYYYYDILGLLLPREAEYFLWNLSNCQLIQGWSDHKGSISALIRTEARKVSK